eukprot:m.33517 g.33517  ORF g.33517 m.33517 type:complete len:341 (+) comp5123_c0_seq2:28-1050(+)
MYLAARVLAARRLSTMSFTHFRDVITEGDTAIMYQSVDAMAAIKIKSGDVYNNKFGSFRHTDIIGKKYGSKVTSFRGTGWIYVLHPTPELWTQVLPHRTQILYAADISMVTLMLDLRPGHVVCESGTGSGSLSHAIARTIAPTGHLHTFEFHQLRADTARKEFIAHGLGDLITVTHADACSPTGFGLSKVADGVFLDLPQPWLALPTATAAMKHGARLVSFSPCIEQVQRMCLSMKAAGFTDLKTVETLERSYELAATPLPVARLSLRGTKRGADEDDGESRNEILPRQPVETRGHTGYLTVGTYVPSEAGPAPSEAGPAVAQAADDAAAPVAGDEAARA